MVFSQRDRSGAEHEASDTPVETHAEKGRNEDELQQFLEAEGYCWQLYPVRMHDDRFCGPVHRAEIEAQRMSATLPSR